MLNPISAAFIKAKQENRPALLTYTVAGDSSKKQSLNILKSISKNADILEVGVPHNTPVADGSEIQTSAYRAIKNGIKVNDIFGISGLTLLISLLNLLALIYWCRRGHRRIRL